MDEFPIPDLCKVYQRQLKVDVSKEFPGDLKSLDLCECSRCGLQFFHPLVSGSAQFYGQLSAESLYYAEDRWEFQRAIDLLRNANAILDIGCGDGVFLSLLPQTNKLGLEFNPRAVARAQQQGLPVRVGKLTDLESNRFDGITLFHVLEHQTRPLEFLRDALRVLQPGGRLIISVPNNDGCIGKDLQHAANAPPHHPLRWREAPLRYLASLLPLTLETVEHEPLSRPYLFLYRRTLIINCIQRILGTKLPLMKVNWKTRFVSRLANALVCASLKVKPGFHPIQYGGFSSLAVFRKIL